MKKCIYYFKGHKIGDVIALNDFLMSSYKYLPILGDKVFQQGPNRTLAILKKASEDNKIAAKKWQQAKKAYANEEEIIKLSPPCVGVSLFLSGLRNSITGQLYFPEFREGDYWASRFHAWTHGKKSELQDHSDGFTEDEINLFFDGDESKITAIPIGDFTKWRDSNGKYLEVFGTDLLLKYKNLMTEKWENQAKLGTEIHNVLELYFKWTGSQDAIDRGDKMTIGKVITELRKEYTAEILETQPDGKVKLVSKKMKRVSNATSDEKIKDILKYASELRSSLLKKYPEATFHPEFTLSAKLSKEFEGKDNLDLVGRLDLVIIDKQGIPHIIDYKTSPKPYEKYSSAKKLAFTYLLATYRRMLQKLGLNTLNTDLMVAPIEMVNFKKNNLGIWEYDSIKKGNTIEEFTEPLNDVADSYSIIKNLDDYIEVPLAIGGSENLISNVKTTFDKWFPKYGDRLIKNDEAIKNLIEKQGGFKKDPVTNKYQFTPKGWSQVIEANTESELFKKVKQAYNSRQEVVVRKTSSIIKAINKAKKDDLNIINLGKDTDEWVVNSLSKYCGENWRIWDDPVAETAMQFGMIFFENTLSKVVEIVKISNGDLDNLNNWGKNRTNLTGAFEMDIVEDSRSNSLMLKAYNGNIELMEAMLVLNNIILPSNISVGGIKVISPFKGNERGFPVSNKELLYTWNKLNKFVAVEGENLFSKNGRIKLLTRTEQCYREFTEIMSRLQSRPRLAEKYHVFLPLLANLHEHMPKNRELALKDLIAIQKELEKDTFGMHKTLNKIGDVHEGVRNYDTDYNRILYQYVSRAILELSNFDHRQTIKDHDPYLEHANILKKGISGNNLDNAGNFGNLLLNQITALALEGYQNARDDAYRKINLLRQKTEYLKQKSGFSGLIEHTYGNQTSLYKDMIIFTPDGDLKFVNPWKANRLSHELLEYLKFIIKELSMNVNPYQTDAAFLDRVNNDDPSLFRVPLLNADAASKISVEGWGGYVKNIFKCFHSWGNFKQSLKDLQSDFLGDDVEELIKNKKEIFEVVNLMNQGEELDRKEVIAEKIARYGEGFFERDLEKILAHHIWAFSTQRALEERMVILKAAYVSLNVMSNELNRPFTEDKKFFREFVTNRINHQSIVDEKLKSAKGVLGAVQKAVSFMALAFAPVQFTGQMLEGIWKDCKLIITKPDGSETFTAKNMSDAAKQVYLELYHTSDIPSVSGAINSQYGINDMDNASFAQNNISNRHGIFNFFGRLAFKFSSRPDFYNRMTIFVAQMKQDGSWEAHSVNEKTGELIYDWTKDKRFKAYANDIEGKHISDKKAWNDAKAMYYTVALLLVLEGVKNKDGSFFKIGDPLPKAYSNKESEAKKAIGDSMYGYYDSTKKSLFQSMLIGGLMMQMRTYWSSKKNQYFAPGGIKAQGKWVLLEQEKINLETNEIEIDPTTKKPLKEKYFYAKNENGLIDPELAPVPEGDPNASEVPFMVWKGKFEEGVVLTLVKFLEEWVDTKSFNLAKINMFGDNVDPELIQTYKSNIRLFLTDLMFFALVGGATLLSLDFADDEKKEAKKSGKLEDAFSATFFDLIYKTLNYSKNDFLWFKSIFDFSMDWNPVAVSYLTKEMKLLFNFTTGDADFSDTVIKSFTATRLVKPIFDCILNED